MNLKTHKEEIAKCGRGKLCSRDMPLIGRFLRRSFANIEPRSRPLRAAKPRVAGIAASTRAFRCFPPDKAGGGSTHKARSSQEPALPASLKMKHPSARPPPEIRS